MLDQETKRKIDSARDILVGKVPDPKAQVEQITTALIYKFMDDMDKESEELGGEAKFFSNGFEKYGWTRITDKRLSGQERLDLYVDAITKMSKNPHIPELFRNIFKDAFLPYRDPETLSLFLKEIDGFTYEHSENLGNAFEYLLSVLGSQGSAGQFRTPRHIIDFIVEVVDPKKNETVLDPACGTAGFLISSYKHIIKHNSTNYEPEQEAAHEVIKEGESAAETVLLASKSYQGDMLSPDDRTKLMRNIEGYDISPDMVKLSLVNLYLHGFVEPKVLEYDTLTSEKRWDENFDVILANPPFMSPKGGIRPHRRFSVQAKRSEVLFVDYILEHLKINGRAGIIVPEGIIFQSANAYKELRRLLIEDGLFAVVSLPPGVFNPYSGVKTSILFFDNQLAKKTNDILFVKIENDGFDLGAQRRKINKNDLPTALKVINNYKTVIASAPFVIPDPDPVSSRPIDVILSEAKDLAQLVPKSKILESGDYNLTGDRYKEVEITANQKWPMVELGKVCKTTSGGTPLKGKIEYYEPGTIPWLRSGEVNQGLIYNSENKITEVGLKNSSAKIFPKNTVLVAMYGATAGKVGLLKFEAATNQAICGILPNEKFLPGYLYLSLRTQTNRMVELSGGGAQPNISQRIIKELKIPLPPIEVQKEIVAQIEVKQAAINGAQEVIKNLKKERRYFAQQLKKQKDVQWVELGDDAYFDVQSGGTPDSKNPLYWDGEIAWATLVDLPQGDGITRIKSTQRTITDQGLRSSSAKLLPVNSVIVSSRATIGRIGIAIIPLATNQGFKNIVIKDESKVLPEYVAAILLTQVEDMQALGTGGTYKEISKTTFSKIKIPLPPLEAQKQLVEEAEKEEEIVTANQKLIQLMESKINAVISDLWGDTNG